MDDMGMDDMGMGMAMYFQWSYKAIILFQQWMTMKQGGYILSCAIIVLWAIFHEFCQTVHQIAVALDRRNTSEISEPLIQQQETNNKLEMMKASKIGYYLASCLVKIPFDLGETV